MTIAQNRSVLVESFGATEGTALRLKQAALVVAGIAFLAIMAKIKVPMWPVPITMGTFGVLALGADRMATVLTGGDDYELVFTSPPEASTTSVAPNSMAMASLVSTASMAIIRSAPANFAPWIMLRPTPPQPITATVLPGCTPAVLIAAPTPVVTPQPTSDACGNGMSGSICTAATSGTTA